MARRGCVGIESNDLMAFLNGMRTKRAAHTSESDETNPHHDASRCRMPPFFAAQFRRCAP
jgi:hypothetical protein